MAYASIPTLDLECFLSGSKKQRARFTEQLGQGLEQIGFVAIVNHGVDTRLLERGYEQARRVFALPDEAKRRYRQPSGGHQRGYTPFGLEHARNTSVPDLKEFWQLGRVLASSHPMSLNGEIAPNVYPDEVPGFALTFSRLYDELEGFALKLLDAVGDYLEQSPDFFRDMVYEGNSVLRVIHYPDLGGERVEGAVRAAAHEDINLLTVLPSSTNPGLELLRRDGEWMAVEVPPNVMICDSGDMMALVTGGQLPATTHRVVNPPSEGDGGRLSMPFFLHPHPEYVLSPLRPYREGPMRARDYLFQRLREIGVA